MNRIGFAGLGTMGLPMAVNMAKAGLELAVFNRRPEKAGPALAAGAKAAGSFEALLEGTSTLVMMLSGPEAIEATLGRTLAANPGALSGKLVANMGTNPPSHSQALAQRLGQVGARYVEAPVFGSKQPAEQGALLVMAAGADGDIDRLAPVFGAVSGQVVKCGEVPKASMMKLAVNLVVIAAGAGLAEGVHFAKRAGLDLPTLFGLLSNGPIGNDFFDMKARKYLEDDYSEQASMATVHEVLGHIAGTAHELKAAIPATSSNLNLVTMAMNMGLAAEDACAILKVLEK